MSVKGHQASTVEHLTINGVLVAISVMAYCGDFSGGQPSVYFGSFMVISKPNSFVAGIAKVDLDVAAQTATVTSLSGSFGGKAAHGVVTMAKSPGHVDLKILSSADGSVLFEAAGSVPHADVIIQ